MDRPVLLGGYHGTCADAGELRRPSCQARGLCHELLPEVIELDGWGYPVITSEVTPELVAAARSAVRGCPTMALRVVDR